MDSPRSWTDLSKQMGRTHTVVADVGVIEGTKGVLHGVALIDEVGQPALEDKERVDVAQYR